MNSISFNGTVYTKQPITNLSEKAQAKFHNASMMMTSKDGPCVAIFSKHDKQDELDFIQILKDEKQLHYHDPSDYAVDHMMGPTRHRFIEKLNKLNLWV